MKLGIASICAILTMLVPVVANAAQYTITTTETTNKIASTSQNFVSTATLCNDGTSTIYMELTNEVSGSSPPTVTVDINSYPLLAGACVTFASLYGDTYLSAITLNGSSVINITAASNLDSRQVAMLANAVNAVEPDARNSILGPDFTLDDSGNFTAKAATLASVTTGSLDVTGSTTLNSPTTWNQEVIQTTNSTGYTTELLESDTYNSNFRVMFLKQFSSGATGQTMTLNNAGLGILAFQNELNSLIYTNGETPIYFATDSILRMEIDPKDGNVAVLDGGFNNTSTDPTLSSFDSNYYSTWTNQVAGNVFKTTLTQPVSDTNGSFRSSVYGSIHDSDAGVYTQSHTDYGGMFGAFGAFNGTNYTTDYKNIIGISGFALANNTSSIVGGTFAPGVEGVTGEAWQYGAGIADNEFAIHNPSAANGSTAESISLAALQGIVDNSYAETDDTTHTGYGFLATNEGTYPITAAFAANGNTAYHFFLDGYNTLVTAGGIVMPGTKSGSTIAYAGTIINYGNAYGNPTGGSYTAWNPSANGGTYMWVDSGNSVAQLSATAGLMLYDPTYLVGTNVALTNYASTNTATLTNAPVAGNPTKWIAINDNNTIRYIPAW